MLVWMQEFMWVQLHGQHKSVGTCRCRISPVFHASLARGSMQAWPGGSCKPGRGVYASPAANGQMFRPASVPMGGPLAFRGGVHDFSDAVLTRNGCWQVQDEAHHVCMWVCKCDSSFHCMAVRCPCL
mmetsp:Transcript_12853/g.22685  ORF Transcript_12853/g.22685 Transcript_12853/m.22685 type:complete len:127 (+) Transcript_12853:638-1018(+)